MTRWVALLRAINLGPSKRVAMADLRALLGSLGYDDVATLLQSGNAVFTSGATASAIEAHVERAVAQELGVGTKVLVRSAKQFAALAGTNPFVAKKIDQKELGATFLAVQPKAAAVAALDHKAYAPDDFAMGDRVVYTRQRNGVMGSPLPPWEKVLGVTATARNWNTVTKLRVLAEA